jgi:hypothetical protein
MKKNFKIGLEWGKIKINDKEFHDVIILPSGKFFGREYEKIKAKYGTGHVIDDEEIELLVKEKPEIIVIGAGFNGKAELTEKAREKILKNKIKLIEKNTPEAIKLFLDLKDEKSAIFHSTC